MVSQHSGLRGPSPARTGPGRRLRPAQRPPRPRSHWLPLGGSRRGGRRARRRPIGWSGCSAPADWLRQTPVGARGREGGWRGGRGGLGAKIAASPQGSLVFVRGHPGLGNHAGEPACDSPLPRELLKACTHLFPAENTLLHLASPYILRLQTPQVRSLGCAFRVCPA